MSPQPADLGLAGRVALVTGATRGVGLAVARRLCAAGARVVLNYACSEPNARRAVEELEGLPGSAVALRADVSDPAQSDGLFDGVRERFGHLDLFVHSAAGWHPAAAVAARPEDLAADMAVAVDPLLRAARPLTELMAGRSGRVVAVSSSGARSVIPQYAGLGMAKAALESLVRYLAVELAEHGIAVNAVSTAKIDKGPGTPQPQVAAALAARTPGGRLTTCADVADVVALLCTSEAGWIRGQVITADGGLSLRG